MRGILWGLHPLFLGGFIGDGIGPVDALGLMACELQGADLDTTVFDNSTTHLDQLAAGEWEETAGANWHRRAVFHTD